MDITPVLALILASHLAFVYGQHQPQTRIVPHGDHLDAVNLHTGETIPIAPRIDPFASRRSPLSPISPILSPVSPSKTTVIPHGDHDHVVTETVTPSRRSINPILPPGGTARNGCQYG